MRLPWRKPNLTKIAADAEHARTAREKAERDLEDTRRQTPKYRRLGAQMRAIREDNHLLQAFNATMGGRS